MFRYQAGIRWAVPVPAAVPVLPPSGGSPPLYSGELSLLDHDLVSLLGPAALADGARLIARNPFADGRLDGSRFPAARSFGTAGVAPVDLRRLHEEFDPVLRLGFLTRDRHRTLAQAALRFVLAWQWVATVVIPLPEPEHFDEILGFESAPELTEAELGQLGLVK